MPDLLANPNNRIVRLAIRATVLGQAHLNYLFYGVDQDISSSTGLRQVAQDVWDHMSTEWLDCVSSDWNLQVILARRVDLYAAPTYFITRADILGLLGSVDGTRGASCPPQDAIVFRKRTNLAGKRGRGRIFLSGVAENDQTGGLVTGALATNMGLLAAKLKLPFVGTEGVSYQPFHCKWVERPIPLVSTLEGKPLDAVDYDTVVRTQRRRQVGRGI